MSARSNHDRQMQSLQEPMPQLPGRAWIEGVCPGLPESWQMRTVRRGHVPSGLALMVAVRVWGPAEVQQ